MSEEYDYPKGGEQGYEGDGPNLRYDDFVARIVQDANAPPSVTLLSGYLGSSSEEGHVRIYLDEELSRYVEIPEKAIRHTQELSPEQSPLGGSLVWIDRDAEVLHGAANSERRKATFLEGQIAQDYIGGAGGIGTSGGGDYGSGGGTTTQTRECGGGIGILPTDMGPGCGQSQSGPCIPPTEQVHCRTLTGIFCTRFGPGCRKTLFEPNCTIVGPNCRTVLLHQCQSVYNPCVTQNESYCQVSGFVPCNPPVDFTIYEQGGVQQQFGQQQFGRQAAFGGGAGGGAGAQGFAAVQPTNFCPPTLASSCPSRLIVACLTRFPNECQFETAVRCISRVVRCPTRAEPRCFASGFVCPDTVAGCQVESVACGVDPLGGAIDPLGGGVRAFDARPGASLIMPTVCDQCAIQTQTPDCGASQACGTTQSPSCAVVTRTPHCGGVGGGAAAIVPTVFCPSRFIACPTQFNCPSRYTACQSQYNRCPSALDACPTRYQCPTLPNGCPGYTQFGSCETVGACPSAVDACPTRFGCDVSQFCGGQSIACNPGGGGGGFDPGGFGGGGFGGGF